MRSGSGSLDPKFRALLGYQSQGGPGLRDDGQGTPCPYPVMIAQDLGCVVRRCVEKVQAARQALKKAAATGDQLEGMIARVTKDLVEKRHKVLGAKRSGKHRKKLSKAAVATFCTCFIWNVRPGGR